MKKGIIFDLDGACPDIAHYTFFATLPTVSQ